MYVSIYLCLFAFSAYSIERQLSMKGEGYVQWVSMQMMLRGVGEIGGLEGGHWFPETEGEPLVPRAWSLRLDRVELPASLANYHCLHTYISTTTAFISPLVFSPFMGEVDPKYILSHIIQTYGQTNRHTNKHRLANRGKMSKAVCCGL